MSIGRPRRHSSSVDEVDEDGNVLWHGVKLGEFWKTDMQVAINDSNRRKDASFMIRMGKAGTTQPYQQTIPVDFARYHKSLFQQSITLEGPTGQTWITVIYPSQHLVRFGRGWRQFSIQNHLQEGYQLLFTLVGRFRFLVQFFDHLGKRCTSYPGSLVVVAETQPQPDLQPGSQLGFQPVVDGGQSSLRHGSEAQTSAAVPFLGTTASPAIPLNSDQDKVVFRQYGPEVPVPEASLPHEHLRMPIFDPRNDSEDTKTEDEETEPFAEENNNYTFQDSDNDNVLFCHPPATKPSPTPVKSDRKIFTLNELLLRKKTKCNQANSPQFQCNNSPSSDDELPDLEKEVKKQVTRKKVTAKRRPPATPPFAGSHNVGDSIVSSPAMRLLQQQGCMRFSDIVSKCKRRDVSVQERRVVMGAAKQFASRLGNETFLVVMRDAQVYEGFHLAIPDKILEATRTERVSKVDVCLVDREQALYKAHWTRKSLHDSPLLDRDAWAKFAVDHTLEEGDVCVFQVLPQLLQSKPAVSVATLLFCVHIFRVVGTHVGQRGFFDAIDNTNQAHIRTLP